MRSLLRREGYMIYADNASTTRLSDKACEAMLPFLRERYGNPSNAYSMGMDARRAIELSRRQAADAIGAKACEIAFTSGGSEANSWVLSGAAESFKGEPTHMIASSIEHHSVLNACRALEARGVEVTYLPVDGNGLVDAGDVERAIRPDTRLVSIMLANNETGAIQPIAEIGRMLRGRGILLHTDAVQAMGHIPIDVGALGADLVSASAHKFNGAKGAGFLYVRSGLSLPRMVFGGEQELGRRAGTENVAGIVALGCALEESVACMGESAERLSSLAEATSSGLKDAIPGVIINGEGAPRLPGVVSATLPRASGEAMMHILDMKGICVSMGSACNSGSDEPSHVLLAMGLSKEQAKSTIRISYGRYNAPSDAERIVEAVVSAYGKIASSQVPSY